MRRYLLVILLFTMFSGCQKKINTQENSRESILQFRDLDGSPVDLASFTGKRVLVNYWAVWCIPCRAEFPSLLEAQEKLQDDNYVFLFPTTDEIEEIMDFQKKKNYPFRYLTFEGSLESRNINVLPSTIIYTTKGEEFKRIIGAQKWDSEEAINLLKQVP